MRKSFSLISPSLMRQLVLLLLVLGTCLLSEYAFAATPPSPMNSNINNCSSGVANWMFTTRIVTCVQSQLLSVVVYLLTFITDLMQPTVAVLFVLAMIFFGIQITMGVRSLTKDTMAFIIKFAILTAISFDMARYAEIPFIFVSTLSGIVTSTFPGSGACPVIRQPWCIFDIYIGQLIGYGSEYNPVTKQYISTPFPLQNGLLGIINTSLYSSLTGILVFVLGALSLLSLLYFALRAVYSYLAALIMISYMMLLAPIMVPLAVFQLTEQRFHKKWFDLLIGAMLNPVLVLAFLAIFLPMIQTIINNFFDLFGGNDFSSYWRSGGTLLSWQVQTPPPVQDAFNMQIGQMSGQSLNAHSSQTFMSPGMSSAMDIGLTDFYTADFGPNQVQMLQSLILSFMGLFMTCYVMLSLLDGVPEISDGIAGVITGLRFEGMPFASELKQIIARVRAAAGGAA